MNRAKLNLLACPALLASMLLVTNPTHAAFGSQPTETVVYTCAVDSSKKLLNLNAGIH